MCTGALPHVYISWIRFNLCSEATYWCICRYTACMMLADQPSACIINIAIALHTCDGKSIGTRVFCSLAATADVLLIRSHNAGHGCGMRAASLIGKRCSYRIFNANYDSHYSLSLDSRQCCS